MRHNLSPLARRILMAMIDVVKPRTDDWDLPLEDTMLTFIDTYVSYFPPLLRMAFPWGLYLLEFAPLIFAGKLTRFTLMNHAQRDAYIDSWTHSSLAFRRDLIKGVRGLALVGFYNDPSTWPFMKFDLAGYIRDKNARFPQPENLRIPDPIKQ